MNIRERIADFISGGAITKLKEDRHRDLKRYIAMSAESSVRWIDFAKSCTKKESELHYQISTLSIDNKNGWLNSNRFKSALEEIAKLSTPNSSAQAKRMAQIAKDALG